MRNTKIEWCDATWNPVTGCYHGCKYCYARRIAERFQPREIYDPEMALQRHAIAKGELTGVKQGHDLDYPWEQRNKDGTIQNAPYPFGFSPTFHRYRLDEPQRWKKPQNIFVCSMADLFGEWAPDRWIEEVFTACEKAPWHRYLFLTKNPQRYIDLAKAGKLPPKDNMWYGTTATTPDEPFFYGGAWHTFVSIEPILRDYSNEIGHMCDTFAQWVIVGAETGNRKGKIIPEKNWIDAITKTCIESNIPLFMKDSLITIVGEENMFRSFPWKQEGKDSAVRSGRQRNEQRNSFSGQAR